MFSFLFFKQLEKQVLNVISADHSIGNQGFVKILDDLIFRNEVINDFLTKLVYFLSDSALDSAPDLLIALEL